MKEKTLLEQVMEYTHSLQETRPGRPWRCTHRENGDTCAECMKVADSHYECAMGNWHVCLLRLEELNGLSSKAKS